MNQHNPQVSAPPTPAASCLEVTAVGAAALGTIYIAVRTLVWGLSELVAALTAVIA